VALNTINQQNSLRCYTCKDGVKLKKSQRALHMWRRGDGVFSRKKNRMIKRPIKYTIKNNNAANYIERFNIPTVLAMFMLCSQHLMIHAT
jgi:hypothetical protein